MLTARRGAGLRTSQTRAAHRWSAPVRGSFGFSHTPTTGTVPGLRLPEGRIAHAVAAVLEVTGDAAEKIGIPVGRDREIVPAEALLDLPPLAATLARGGAGA